MFGNVLLEPEQKELLIAMVEAHRNVPKAERQGFYFLNTRNGFIIHPGFPNHKIPAFFGDLEALANVGLLQRRYDSRGTPIFDVTPLGFKYYEHLSLSAGQPIMQVEEKIRSYLESDHFKKKYANAFQKWTSANDKLWSTDSEKQLTEIGHLCREAMQEFVTVLVDEFKPPQVDTNKAHTVARLKALTKLKTSQLGETIRPFLDALTAYLDALIVYWGTVSDLVQRQEHANLKEGKPLVWEDGRRVVFQTAIVMFEIGEAMSRKY
ncbi:MAG: hypothetical protein ACOZF2_09955 [Thermodesulfobacteriota bacterium]